MTLTPRFRKLMLMAHVTASVGWLGAVAGFLALAIAGVASDDVETVRAAYLAMETVGWSVLVPLSIASLVTGLVQALGTTWGLVRHYWVVIKFLLTIVATSVLLLYMSTLGDLAALAAETTDPVALRSASPVLHGAAASVLLLVATTLGIYKPRGMTRYGRRYQSGPPN